MSTAVTGNLTKTRPAPIGQANIALFGIAVETAVVMMVYLRGTMDARLAHGTPLGPQDIAVATINGAVLRLRPVLRRHSPSSAASRRSRGN